MIHRAPFGSLERLIGILIEEYAGDFPRGWAPSADAAAARDRGAAWALPNRWPTSSWRRACGTEVEASGDRLGKMVRNAEKAKVPIMAVVGAKELEGQRPQHSHPCPG
jgi:threonyl-tRNA synthetase